MLYRDEEDDELRVGAGEPARKRSRPLVVTEEPITRSYTLGGHAILKGTAKRLSNIWSWMSSLITPTFPNEDMMNAEVHPNEIQYVGVSQRRHTDTPTKRPAIHSRRMEIKRDHQPNLASIDAAFRFNPSITSTTAKGTAVPSSKSLPHDRYMVKNPFITRTVLSPHRKKSTFAPHAPLKRLYDIKHPLLSSKAKSTLCSKLMGRGKSCIQEVTIRCMLSKCYAVFVDSLGHNLVLTTAFRHEDKMRYQKLLQQYGGDTPTSYFRYSKVPSITSLNSSRSTSPQSIISRTHHDSRWTKDKRKEIEETAPKSKPHLSKPPLFTFPSSQRAHGKKMERDNVAARPNSESSNTQSTKESENDCVIIAEDIKSPSRRSSLEQSLLESPVLDDKFIRELNDKYNHRAKMKLENAKKTAELSKLYEEVRKQAQPSLQDRIARRMALLNLSYPSKIEEIVDEKEEEEEEELPELTPQMIDVIEDALDSRAPGQVLVDKFNIQITRRDIATLSGLNWLNDEVINFYMNLLMERGKNDNYLNVHAFNTFFYPKLVKTGYSSVRRWTKKVDVFSHDLLLVPVHLGMHWCLATIDFRTKHVRYYDSMLGDNDRCLEALLKYLESEHLDKKQSNYETSSWTLDNVKRIPQQMNGSDCGMFACKFSEYLSRDARITFDQQHMPYFRRRMIYEIVSAKLL